MCYVRISANEYVWNIKYLNFGERDQDMIDHRSWPEFFFRLNLHNCLSCVYNCDGQSCLGETAQYI